MTFLAKFRDYRNQINDYIKNRFGINLNIPEANDNSVNQNHKEKPKASIPDNDDNLVNQNHKEKPKAPIPDTDDNLVNQKHKEKPKPPIPDNESSINDNTVYPEILVHVDYAFYKYFINYFIK